ncbi:hypothetical protein CKO51_19305 [Rhodopirellula sp. SM50]|nr:Ig-like domain-containing protein [Rhodopirellula sp. SM50]PAY17842.1 hypothetical protein CKO51_19305 [Rhodopirellula sp. SM50]
MFHSRRKLQRRLSKPQRRRLAAGLQTLERRHLLAAEVLLADSFEAGQWAGNWVEDSQNDWFTSSQRSTDGSSSAEIDGWASNATLTTSTPIDLSGYSSAELTFDWLIERGFDGGEYLSLDLSTDGGTSWQTDVRRLNGNVDAENSWHSESVDLSSYTTSQLLVRFRSKVSRSNEDANVDNVKITAVPQTPAFPPSIDYADFSDASELNLVGHAATTPDRLRLTPAESSRIGAAWHHDKQFVSVGFETTFQFQMTEPDAGGGADAFAFVIQDTSDTIIGAGGGHSGFHQIPNSLAVEFDTTQGTDESSDSHVSIHTRGTERNSSKQEFSLGSFDTSGFKLNDGNVHTAKIAYTPGTMSVFLDNLASPALTIPLDLDSMLNLDLGSAYVGFTAATGGGWQNHDILNWSFANLTDTTTTIGIEDSASAEGNAGQSGIDFVVKRFGDLSGSHTVDWVTSAGSATAGVDYAAASGQVTFAAGEAEKIITVAIIGDTTEEEHETFEVDILVSQGSAAIVDGQATGTIQNDETSLSVGDAAASEGGTDFQFVETYIQSSATGLNATRSLHLSPDGFLYAGASVPPSVRKYHYDTGAFVGLVAEDVNLASSTYRGFVFGPDGDFYVADVMYERVLRFDASTGVSKGAFVTSGLGGLDTPKDLAFGSDLNLYVASANSGEVLRYQGPFAAEPGAFMGVVASAANGGLGSPDALTFGPGGNLYISDGSNDSVLRVDAVTGVVDTFVQPAAGIYDASSAGGLQFGPDRTGDGIPDLYASSYNTDSLLVFDGVDGSLAQELLPTGLGGLYRPTGFVIEPDGNLLVASIGGPDKVLRFAETSKAVFTVTLSKPSALPVSVDYTTQDQTATTANGDYTTHSGTLTFPPGVTSRTISIQTNDDGSFEFDETFKLVLSNPVSASITDTTGVGTIVNDDVVPIYPPTIDYVNFSDVSDLNLVGHATKTADNRIRLTDAGLRQGSVWHKTKQSVSTSFETQFDFVLDPNAHGLVFVIQNTRPEMLGGGAGFDGIPNSLAVEFDTKMQSNQNDPNDNHVSIQSRGLEHNSADHEFSLGTATSLSDMNDGQSHTAMIRYASGVLSVFVDDLASPILSASVDINELLDLDFGQAWVGFTSGNNRHEVLNWQFRPIVDLSTTIGIHDAEILEGDNGTQQLVFQVQRMGTAAAGIHWNTADDSAIAGSDYTAASGSIQFAAGGPDIQQVAVPILGDTSEEAFEDFFVDLSVTSGQVTVVDDRATGTILNDDAVISISDASAVEGDPGFTFTDEFVAPAIDGLWTMSRGLDVGPDGNLYVTVEQGPYPGAVLRYNADTGDFMGAFATHHELDGAKDLEFGPDGNLYVTNNRTDKILRFNGATGQFIDVFVAAGGALNVPRAIVFGTDNNLYVANANSDEILRYQGPTGQNPGQLIDVFVSAGEGGMDSPTTLTFGPDGTLYVASGAHATYNNSILRFDGATGDFIDAFDASGTSTLALVPTAGLIFGPDLNGDGIGELYASNGDGPAEVLAFDPTTGALLEKVVESGTGGLVDPKGLAFTSEGDLLVVSSGTRNILRYSGSDRAAFRATLSSPIGQTVTVDFSTTNGTATSDSDYLSASGTLTFAAGVTNQTILVSSIDDSQFELDETFQVTLDNPNGVAIADGTGVGTLIDNDPMPVNNLPVADDDAYAIAEDGVLSVPVSGVLDGDTDADNDPLTASLVSQASSGVVVLSPDGSFTYTPDANFNGSDSFTYTAFDGIGNSNVATVNLTVSAVNDAPVANSQSVSTMENTPKTVTLSGSDVEGDSLSFAVLAGPTSGNLSGTAPNLIYTPDTGFTGSDSFTFVANDGTADSATATITINVTDNNAPIANPQSIGVDEDGSVAIQLTGSDQDSDPITFQVVDAPLHGNLTGTAPNLSYTPDANYNGVDSFTFQVNDGTDDSGLATVSLTVNPINDAPTANAQSVSTSEDTQLAITLSGNDLDGDSLGYILVAGPANGTLVGSGANRTYTPDANFHGGDSFTFKVNDGQVDSPVVTVSIDVTAVNDAPVATADSHPLDQDTTLSVPAPGVLGNDVDVDGDSITAALVTTTGSGSLTLGSDGSFDYTPDPGFVGSDSFSYQVDDGSIAGNTVTVTLTVNAVSAGPNLSHGEVVNVGDSWQTVTLATSYTSMVVIATPRYNSGSGPGVVRIRDAAGSRFQVRVDNVGASAFSGGVHYVVVEEGVYDEAGFKLEAVKYSENQTSRKSGWLIDTVGYQQSYISPVVVGQVMTANDEDWSVFWASSGSRTSPPSSTALNVGKHVAEDPDTARASETIGYLVIEATQSGTIEGLPFVAGVGGDSIRGVGNGSYQYSYDAMPNAKTAVLSSAGMDGGDGGWAVLRGNNPVPATSGAISLSIDEDQLRDSERNHTTEQVAYFVIDPPIETASEASIAAPVVFNFSARTESVVSQNSKDTEGRPILQSVPQKLALAASGPTSAMLTGRIRAIDSVIAGQRESEEHLPDNLLELLAATTSLKHWKS